MPDSLQPHGLQHAKPSCPSLSLQVCPSSCLLHLWCYPVISFSDVLFSFCPQSFPAPGTFPMSWLCIRWPKYWSFSISPSSQYSGLISLKIDGFDLLAQGTFRSLLQHHSLKASILWPLRPNIQHKHNQYTTSHVKTECCHQPFSGDWLPALPDAYLWTACHLEEWCASDQLFGRVMHMLIKTVKQINKQKNTLLRSKIKGKCLLTSSSCKIFIS